MPLQKHFEDVGEKYSLFFLSLEIHVNEDYRAKKHQIVEVVENYKLLSDQNILVFYKGDFSGDSNSNLVEMLHDNFISEKSITSGNIKNMISVIEVVQNVSKHGKEINGHKTGMFSLKQTNGDIYIECGNFIELENYQPFKKYIESIKSSSADEIQKLYKRKLYNSEISEHGDSGIGLLEIALFTRNKFSYSFMETAENEIFYTIKIKTE